MRRRPGAVYPRECGAARSRPSGGYGFELAKLLAISNSTVYRACRRLEGMGLLDCHWGPSPYTGAPSRKIYKLRQ